MWSRSLFFFVCLLGLCSCGESGSRDKQAVIAEIEKGNFVVAEEMIDSVLATSVLSEAEIYDLNFEKDRMNRIRRDFRRSREDVLRYIRRYYPAVTDAQMEKWEKEKSLEVMCIDGEKRYLANAAPNLFRIDEEARKVKEAKEGTALSGYEQVNRKYLPEVIRELKRTGKTQMNPIKMRVRYTLTVDTNAVPEGEVIRCWLPYPREDNRRQSDVKLLSVNDDSYVVAPVEQLHRTVYMEKRQEKDQPTVFSIAFEYNSSAEWFDLREEDFLPYDTGSGLYKQYTSERAPHVVFSDRLRQLTQEVVGEEQSVPGKLRKIFKYINDTYPWASAREYSTLRNLPEYVVDNGHGDCGQVALLFITMARISGIPAKWQSGFMMHPQALNMHDWAEFYVEGVGWVPLDQSFGIPPFAQDEEMEYFFSNGIDAYRWIVNDDYSQPLYPAKVYPRSETVDFQRGEVEWAAGNLYFDQWKWDIEVEYGEN